MLCTSRLQNHYAVKHPTVQTASNWLDEECSLAKSINEFMNLPYLQFSILVLSFNFLFIHFYWCSLVDTAFEKVECFLFLFFKIISPDRQLLFQVLLVKDCHYKSVSLTRWQIKRLDEICLELFIESSWVYRKSCLNGGTHLSYDKHIHILFHFCYTESSATS